MKILVCISKTPDTTSKIAFINGNTKFDEAGVQWIINPYDEWYSLVRAIELKEKDSTISIHLVTVGLPDCDPIIRKALALGGDEPIRVNTDSTDSYYIAAQIAVPAVARMNPFLFARFGKRGQMITAVDGGIITLRIDEGNGVTKVHGATDSAMARVHLK